MLCRTFPIPILVIFCKIILNSKNLISIKCSDGHFCWYLSSMNELNMILKMNDIEKVFGTKRGNGILNTTLLMVKTTYDDRQKGRGSTH